MSPPETIQPVDCSGRASQASDQGQNGPYRFSPRKGLALKVRDGKHDQARRRAARLATPLLYGRADIALLLLQRLQPCMKWVAFLLVRSRPLPGLALVLSLILAGNQPGHASMRF